MIDRLISELDRRATDTEARANEDESDVLLARARTYREVVRLIRAMQRDEMERDERALTETVPEWAM